MNNKEYIVVSRNNGKTRRGDDFCSLKLRNLEEEMTIAVWDVSPTDQPQVGQLVSFTNIQENDGKKSARKTDMLPGLMPNELHPLYTLLPRPISRGDWDKCLNNLVGFCSDERLVEMIRKYGKVLFEPYSKYPAASNIHHAFKGGLLNHTYQMLHMLEGLYQFLPYTIKIEHCILGILFHDYGKVYEYKTDGEATEDRFLLGHIFISANRLYSQLRENEISDEEINRIVHVVLAHHGELEFGSPVKPCSKEAIVVNMLDNLSAKLDTIENTGNMEKNFALGTNVVKN